MRSTLGRVLLIALQVGFHTATITQHSKTVFFAFSGLRWDSNNLQKMSSIERIKARGVWAKRKVNAFQSESLPSFVTISSGKYPNEHRMLSNKMRNLRGELFDVTKTSSKVWWKDFEPIWIRNQKHNRSSALCFWPGYDVTFNGGKVHHFCSHKNKLDPFKEFTMKSQVSSDIMSFKQRTAQVKTWLQMNDTNSPSFIGAYFEEPLQTMVKYGVLSNDTKKMLTRIDKVINDMLDWMDKQGMTENINFIVAGESGVTNIHQHKELFLDDQLTETEKNKYDVIDNGPIMSIYPHDKQIEKMLLSKWKSNVLMKVYSKNEIPESFHFKQEKLTMPITIVAREHWRIYNERVVDGKKSMMGYDGKYESAHALFVAQGPAFKENVILPAIGNVDVYGILCRALDITAAPHSGNVTTIKKMMKSPEKWLQKIVKKFVEKITESPRNFILTVVVAVVLFLVASFLVVAAIYKAIGCCCKCDGTTLKVNVSPQKFLRKHKDSLFLKKKESGEHLLSDKDLSDSDISSSDEYYLNR